jgi:rare lipoprotein A
MIVFAGPSAVPVSIDGMAKLHCFAIRLVVSGALLAAWGRAQEQRSAFPLEEGFASWYGPSFDGQRSASGEIFDSGQLTAAHRTLPFGTWVRVRRLDSAQSIVVRINDRGPYVGERIIDLSYAAARRIGLTEPGLSRVALEVVESAPVTPMASPVPLPQGSFAVQAGTFRDPDNVRRTREFMAEKFGAVTVQRSGEFWCVLVGNAATPAEAETLANAVRQSGQAYRSAFVVHAGGR